MKKIILLFVFAISVANVFGVGTTYYWVGGNTSTGSFTTTSNWNTTRGGGGSSPAAINTTANSADIFIFDYLNVGSSTTGTSITINNVLTSYQLGGIQVVGGNNLNVKFSGGGAVTLNTNLVVDANSILEFTSNTFSFGGSFSPTVNGTLIFGAQSSSTVAFPIGTDWTANSATGTIAHNYNYPQGNCRIIPATYYNLDADYGTGVTRNFGTSTSSTQNFYIKGNFYYTAAANAVQTSVFTFNGVNQTIAPTSFYGLVIGGTGVKTISKNGSVGNTLNTLTNSSTGTNAGWGLTINSGTVLDLGDFTLSGTVISNSGEIRAASAVSLPTPGTLPWGGTVTYNGTASQSIPATSFTSLKITGAKSSSVSFTGTSTSGSAILTNISSTSGLMGLTSGTITGSAGIGALNATTNTISSVTRGATIKGNTTNSSALFTTVNATNLAVGMTLSGTGISTGTTINLINPAVNISTGITATSGNTLLSATSTTGVVPGMYVIAAGNAAIPSGTAVTVTEVVANTSITLSSAPTGNVSTATGISFSSLITMSTNATATNTGTTITCSPIITMGSSASASNSSQGVSIPSVLTFSGTTNVASNMTVDYTAGYGSIVNTGSTFNFNGAGAQTIPSLNYNNLTISGSRSGDITLASSGSIGIAGTFTNSATFTSGSFVNTSSTVNFNGAVQSIPAFTFNHLTLSGSGAKTLNAATVINGNLSLQGTASTSTVAATTIGGSLSVGDGTNAATFTAPAFALTVTGSSSVANASTLTISSSTGAKTFTGLVTLNGGGIWNNSGNSAVALNGGLTIGGSSVTFTPGTNTTTITGALTTNGTFSLSAGIVSLSGTSSIAGSTSPTFNTLTLAGSAAVTASTNFTVSGALTIGASASLDMGTNNLLGATSISNSGTFKTSSIGTTPYPSGLTIAGIVQFAKTDGGQTIPIGNYSTLTLLNGSETNTSSGGAVNATTLNTTAGGIWDLGITATLGGSLSTINHNGIIKTAVLSSTSIVPTTTKDFTAGGNATGTVEFYGTGNQSLQNNSGTKFYNLIVRSGSIATAVTATSSLTVNGTLTIEGTMDMGTSSLNLANNVLGTGTFKTQNTGTPITTGKTWGGTVQYNSTSTQTVVAGNYNNLDLTAASSGNRTLINGGTIGIAGIFTPSTTGTHTVTSNTISFNGSSSQTIPAFAYNNLTVNNVAGVNLGASITVPGNLSLTAGTLAIGANTLTLSGTAPTRTSGDIDASNASSVIAFTNGTAMALPASLFSGNISTLTMNGSGGVTLGSGITITGALNLTLGTLTNSALNIITFGDGTNPVTIIRTAGSIAGVYPAFAGQSLANLTYNNSTSTTSSYEFNSDATKINNLTINNSGGVIINGDRTVNGTLNLIAGTLAVGNSSNSRVFTFKGGNITRTSGTIDAGVVGATGLQGLTFANTTALTLPSGLFSGNIYNLTLNGIGGVTLGDAITVNNVLTLTSGKITTSTNVLTIGATGSVSGGSASSYIYGNLKKLIAASTTTKTFEIGDATTYAPVTLAFAGTISNSDGAIQASTASGEHANIATSGIDAAKSVNRTWTISNPVALTGLTSYSPTFTFVTGDKDAGTTTSSFIVGKYASSAWSLPTVGTKTATSTQATGITGFGDFAIGEATVVATPTISTTGTLSAVNTTYGSPSASPSTFSVSGADMSAGILVTPPTGYEVSLASGSGYGATVTVPGTGTISSTPVYVRLLATATVASSPYSGNIVLSSTNATSVNVATVSSSVAAKALTITANNVNKTYGTALSGAAGSTAFTSSALANSETIGSVTIAYGTGAAANAAVNTYSTSAVVPSAAIGVSFTASNYNITYVDGNIIVTAKALIITANNKTVTHGTAAFKVTDAGTYSVTGFVNSETASVIGGSVSYSTNYTNATAVDASGISITPIVTGLTSPNYSFTPAAGTITISAATTIVTAPVGATNLSALSTDVSTDIVVPSTGVLAVNSSPTVNSVTVNAGGILTVASPLTIGTVIFKAGKEATASATPSAYTFSTKLDANITATTVRVYKTIDDLKWYFMSFPCDVTISQITKSDGSTLGTLGAGGDWFIKYYDGQNRATNGPGSNWKHIALAPDPTKLLANHGYIFGLNTVGATYEVEMSIPLASSVLSAESDGRTVPVTAFTGTAGGTNNGWNLVGQPYMSNFNGNGKTTAAFMSFPDGNNATYTPISNGENYYITPMGAYFVQVGSGTTITFDKLGRQGVKSTVAIDLSDRVQLNFASATGTDKTNLIMDNTQSTAYEIGQDFEKMIGTGTDKPQVYSMLGGINYAYNALPMSSVTNLPIGIYTKTAGSTTISVDATQAPSLSKLLLTDYNTSPATVTNLLTSNYTFTAAAGTNNSRFAITAQRIATDNNVIGNELGETQLIIDNSKLIINNLANNTTVRVYDALGRMVISKTATSNTLEIKLNARGIYTVQLQNGSIMSTRKVIF